MEKVPSDSPSLTLRALEFLIQAKHTTEYDLRALACVCTPFATAARAARGVLRRLTFAEVPGSRFWKKYGDEDFGWGDCFTVVSYDVEIEYGSSRWRKVGTVDTAWVCQEVKGGSHRMVESESPVDRAAPSLAEVTFVPGGGVLRVESEGWYDRGIAEFLPQDVLRRVIRASPRCRNGLAAFAMHELHIAHASLPGLQDVDVAEVLMGRHWKQHWTDDLANNALFVIKSLTMWESSIRQLDIRGLIDSYDTDLNLGAELANEFGEAIGALPGLRKLHLECADRDENDLSYNLVISRFVRTPGAELFNATPGGRPDCCPLGVWYEGEDEEEEDEEEEDEEDEDEDSELESNDETAE